MKKWFVGLGLMLLTALSQAQGFKDGEQYVSIKPAPPVSQDKTLEVMEFFWYGCPHCYRLEPSLEKWKKSLPQNVKVTRMPVMFGGPASMHAKMFYALEIMGESERMHDILFKEMHEGKKNRLATTQKMEAFLEANGVDMEKFRTAMASFTVQTKTNRVAALMRRYGVSSVPTLVVDGRFRSGRVRNFEEMLNVTDYLIHQVTELKKKQAPVKK